jgi:D-alanyl-lipoteichoic acid acyltransferase DltB (MBOAT superfamily)
MDRPQKFTLLNAAGLFVVFCILAEMVGRAAFVQDHMPYQAYGMNHTQLEIELTYLDEFVGQHGAPDCFVFGSSQAFREIDPRVFARAYAEAGGVPLTCYNFGITGSQVSTTSILNQILIEKYKPRLVVIGTSFLDYTPGRESQVDQRFKENGWLAYKTGHFTIAGWLTEHSFAWRVITLLSYAAPFGMDLQEVLREAHKWDGEIAQDGFALSNANVNPRVPVEEGFVKNLKDEFGDFSVSDSNLTALENIVQTSQQEGAAVVIAEMVYHPALLDLKDDRGDPRVDRTQILDFRDNVNRRILDIANSHSVPFLEFDPAIEFPNDGWYDLYHLNHNGAQVYSRWLGGQAAALDDLFAISKDAGQTAAALPWQLNWTPPSKIGVLSLDFAILVLVTLVIYYLLPGRLFQNLWLLLVSYFFLYTWYPYQIWILIGSTLINFGMGLWLPKAARFKKWILWFGVLLNAGVLLWFLTGGPILFESWNVTALNVREVIDLFPLVILPLGMSYYALNNISYLLDINMRVAKPITNPVDYALYLAWFPKLVSGPLERGRKFLPQLAEKRVVDNAAITQSLNLILVGMFRAAILGGLLSIFIPARPLSNPSIHGNPVLLWAILAYMFYLYNQFAGYTDIVRGVSGLFGLQLSRNFAWPFFSKDFSDFWLRWHISLSSWLRDYVYMPISRAFLRKNPSRNNIPNLIVPPLVTMLVSGLWHGAKPNLLVWGLLMGLFIMFENIRSLSRPAVPAKSIPLWRRIVSIIPFAILILIATVPFNMEFKNAAIFYKQLILGWNGKWFDLRPVFIPFVSLFVDWLQYRKNDEFVFLKWPGWTQSLLAASVVLGSMAVMQLQSAPPIFVYP